VEVSLVALEIIMETNKKTDAINLIFSNAESVKDMFTMLQIASIIFNVPEKAEGELKAYAMKKVVGGVLGKFNAPEIKEFDPYNPFGIMEPEIFEDEMLNEYINNIIQDEMSKSGKKTELVKRIQADPSEKISCWETVCYVFLKIL
jgi:hypothetical protein